MFFSQVARVWVLIMWHVGWTAVFVAATFANFPAHYYNVLVQTLSGSRQLDMVWCVRILFIVPLVSFVCQYYLFPVLFYVHSFFIWLTGRNRLYSLQWWSKPVNLPSLHQPLRTKWIHASSNSCRRNHSGLWQVFITDRTVNKWQWLWIILLKMVETIRM